MSGKHIINHDEAHHLALLKKDESNLARCYLQIRERAAELEAALLPFANAHRWLHSSGMSDAMRKQYEASMSCTGKFGADDLARAADLV